MEWIPILTERLPLPEDGYTFNMLVVDVMVPFYPCFNFNFLLFLGMVTMIMSLKQKKMEIPPGDRSSCGGLLPMSMAYTGSSARNSAP